MDRASQIQVILRTLTGEIMIAKQVFLDPQNDLRDIDLQ